MADLVRGWGPGGFQASGGPQVISPEEKLASMKELLSPDMLGLLMRLIQNGAKTPPAPPQQWNNLHQMPGAIPPAGGIPGVSGAMPMQPSEPPRFPTMMSNPGFVRG